MLGIKIVRVSPSLGTIFFSAISFYILLSNLLLQELLYVYLHLWEQYIIILCNLLLQELLYLHLWELQCILLSNLLLQELLYFELWKLYSSQQCPSSKVIVSLSLGTIFFQTISFFKSFCIYISGNNILLSNLLLQELLYLHLWELQYILLSNLLLG